MIPLDTLLGGAEGIIKDSISDADQALIVRACELSPFFLRTLQSDTRLLDVLVEGLHRSFSADEMSAFVAVAGINDENSLKRTLRRLRKNVMLRLIARDLNGLADFAEVVAACTTLAEFALNVAVRHLHVWQQQVYGRPVGSNGMEQNLMVVGMGKLGGGELNVSSDIDLIFAYAEDGVTDGGNPVSNHEYFSRLGKKLIAAIGETTEDGFVFRVDMRLRPDGDSGPLVSSFEALEQYYQTHGREWERYAWIKGRVVVGENTIERLLKPFVYRKYLDFGAIDAMRALKQKIEREVSQRDMHDDIKLGRGGIREVEFVVQVFQLIRGGQHPALQVRPTMQALALLATKGLTEAENLRQAYVFLRNVEHRLQYLHDAQTQRLPQSNEDRGRIASAMGYDSWDTFLAALEVHRRHVATQFAAVFSEKSATGQHPMPATASSETLWTDILEQERWPEAQQALAALGFQEQAAERLRSFAHGVRYRQLPAVSQKRLAALMPSLLQSVGQLHNRDETLGRVLDLLEAVCRRANYLALFTEYPQILGTVSNICSASPWLSGYLTQHPLLLDELLDNDSLYAAPDFAALKQELEQRLQGADAGLDVEIQLDRLRHFKHSWIFRLAAQDIMGHVALETLSDYLSALADMLLDAVLKHAWTSFKQAHRPQPAFALIAYGKLGGKEFGYASDVDVVFLYDDEAEGAGEIYARFAQRVNHWLNSPTTAGILYETDLRLRPDGVSGLLVSSLAAFADYQRQRAWVWEHQALTRARFCAGDESIGRSFETIRHDVLCQPRDAAHIALEVSRMRHKMWQEHPNTSGLFDIKHDAGGIVDVEFIVQTLVLSYAHEHPELSANLGNIALLLMAGELGLIPLELAQDVAQAYRIYRQHQHRLRLQGESRSRMEKGGFEQQIKQVRALWEKVVEPTNGVPG